MKNRKSWIYYVTIAILVFIVIFLCVGVAHADNDCPYDETETVWTDKMNQLHQMADWARALGYSEDSPIIVALSNAWWEEYYNEAITAKVIEGEAGNCTFDHMVYVGAVLWNRVYSDRFPDTVYECVTAPMQYSWDYVKNFHTLSRRCWLAARDAMNGTHDAPEDLYWQANFPQGLETWKIIEWRGTYTYLCRG